MGGHVLIFAIAKPDLIVLTLLIMSFTGLGTGSCFVTISSFFLHKTIQLEGKLIRRQDVLKGGKTTGHCEERFYHTGKLIKLGKKIT